MRIAAQNADTDRRVYLLLADTARHLTSQDLWKITEAVEPAHAIVHILDGSWQVRISVPEIESRRVGRVLQAMGYAARILSGEIPAASTYVLKGKAAGLRIQVFPSR